MKKLVQLMEEKGLSRTWLVKKTGLTRPMLTYVLRGDRKIAPKYWERVVNMSEGLITYQDLVDYNAKEWEEKRAKTKK